MREALARWCAPMLARLPDPRHVPMRKQVTVAIVASAVFHALLFFIAVLLLALGPDRVDFARAKPKLQPLEVQLIPPTPEIAQQIFTLKELQQRELIDSEGLAKADKAPEDPTFESDANMRAASELPATGDKPVPSVDGRTGLPFENFKTQDVHLGAKPAPEASDVVVSSKPAPVPVSPPKPTPPLEPLFKPEPASVAKPTPPPQLKPVVEPRPGDIVLFSPKPATPQPIERLSPPSVTPPPIAPPNKPQPSTDLAKLITPVPRPTQPSKPGYQPQQEKTKIQGSISNRGKTSVDALRTPRGVYDKQVSEAVGSRWYYYVGQHRDLYAIGGVKLIFKIDRQGKVRDLRILENSSNSVFANMCEQCVREAEIAPPPPDVIEAMKNETLEVPFSFTLY
jgi:protein TonB